MFNWGLTRTALLFPAPAAWFLTFVAMRSVLRGERTFKGLAAFVGCLAAGATLLALTHTLHLAWSLIALWAAAYVAGAATTAGVYWVLEAITSG